MMYPNVFCRYSKKTSASEDSVRRAPSEDTMLYPIDVMQSTDTHVKIHYIGYSLKFDEWRAREDVIQLDSPCIVDDYDFN